MLKNYFKTAWRSLLRERQSTCLNLIGLSTGLTCAILIFLWVDNELHIDSFNKKDNQLYQVMHNYPTLDGVITVDWTPGLLSQSLKKEIPEIEYAVPAKNVGAGILAYNGKFLKAEGQFAGKDYFNIFSFPLIEGNKQKALSDKYNALVSETMALKLFGSTRHAVGKTISWNKSLGDLNYGGKFIVSGIFKNVPEASKQVDVIMNYDVFFDKEKPGILNWENFPVSTYMIVKKGADEHSLNQKITQLIQSRNNQTKNAFFIKQFSKNYLYGHYENGRQAGGRIEYVRLFSIIGIVVLVIASINFMNLSTAKATTRTKEIGIKKTMGATRMALIIQFISESFLMTFIALFIAIILVILLLPQFNQITGKQLAFGFQLRLIMPLFAITVLTALLSSSYPALYLSGFNPVTVLKGIMPSSFGEQWTRKGLVVFQFTMAVILIVSVIVSYRQMALVQSKNLGYNRNNIIVISKEGELKEKLESFLTEMKRLPGVLHATNANENIVGNNSFTTGIDWEGKTPGESMLTNVFRVNYDFLETFDIRIKKGRSFSQQYGTDTAKVILNEAAVKTMRLIDPVGKTIKFWGKDVQIIGVTDNFQYQSLHKNVEPCIFSLFQPGNNYGNQIYIKIKAGEELSTIERVKKIHRQFNPGIPFEFRFLEDDYQALYESENKVAALSKYFAAIAILLSCLGLFGLASFTAQKRRKEIGIRKVIGASVSNIMVMLSKDFLGLVSIALFIAFPVSWWLMNNWLQGFAYRTSITPFVFLIAGVSVMLIAFFTISYQAIKAALANPVKSLRTE